MTEYNSHPTWFYKPVVVDNLSIIQSEVKNYIYKTYTNFDELPPQFNYVKREDIEQYVPSYVNYIDSLADMKDKHLVADIIDNVIADEVSDMAGFLVSSMTYSIL